MIRATWNGSVIAESNDTVVVEGNHYFPLAEIDPALIRPSDTHSVCPWKGTASYYDVVVDGQVNQDAAWYYPTPKPAAREIDGRVAFWHGVRVEEVGSDLAATDAATDAATEPPPAEAQRPGLLSRFRRGDRAVPPPVGDSKVLDLTDATFADALTSGFTLVDLWAPWCGPCKRFHPTFEAIAADRTGDALRFARVNVDDNPEIATRFQIRSIPTLLLLDADGNVVAQRVGAQPRAAVEAMLDGVTSGA